MWLYSQYKHLKEMPALEMGQRVKVGQRIALTGSTGTRGRHYGSGGHPHLHLTAFMSPDDRYAARAIFFPLDGQWIDPLAVYRGEPLDTPSVRSLSGDAKSVAIPYLTEGGTVVPAGKGRLVWPYACKPAITMPSPRN